MNKKLRKSDFEDYEMELDKTRHAVKILKHLLSMGALTEFTYEDLTKVEERLKALEEAE